MRTIRDPTEAILIHLRQMGAGLDPDFLREAVRQFRARMLEGAYPYIWLDALYLKVRLNHRMVSQAVVIAIGVKETGEREILGFDTGPKRPRC